MAFVRFRRRLVATGLGEGGQVDDDVVDHQTTGDQAFGDNAYVIAEAYRRMVLGRSLEQSIEKGIRFRGRVRLL